MNYIIKNKTRNPNYYKEYYQKNKERYSKTMKIYYIKNREILKAKSNAYRKNNRELVKLGVKKSHYMYSKNLRYHSLNYYSGGTMACGCCGENTYDLLTIDHVNNDGKEHRTKIKTNFIHRWLKQNDYPKGFQVLCMNCNWGRSQQPDKICPHKKLIREVIFQI